MTFLHCLCQITSSHPLYRQTCLSFQKLRQVEELKEQQKAGKTLEKNQVGWNSQLIFKCSAVSYQTTLWRRYCWARLFSRNTTFKTFRLSRFCLWFRWLTKASTTYIEVIFRVNDFHTGCRNVIYNQQKSFSGLHSPDDQPTTNVDLSILRLPNFMQSPNV